MRRLPVHGEQKMLAKIKDRLTFFLMVAGLFCLFFGLVLLMGSVLGGCGDYGSYYGSDYGDYDYTSTGSCAGICERHCNTCWSWTSDILQCETRCETLCRQRGCDYITVPSKQCDDAFQSTCS